MGLLSQKPPTLSGRVDVSLLVQKLSAVGDRHAERISEDRAGELRPVARDRDDLLERRAEDPGALSRESRALQDDDGGDGQDHQHEHDRERAPRP